MPRELIECRDVVFVDDNGIATLKYRGKIIATKYRDDDRENLAALAARIAELETLALASSAAHFVQ